MKFFALTLFSGILVLFSACTTIEIPYNKNSYNPNITISSDVGNKAKIEHTVALYGGDIDKTLELSASAKNILTSNLVGYNFNNKTYVNIDLLKITFLEYMLQQNEITCYLQSTVNNQVVKTKVFSKKKIDDGLLAIIFAPIVSECFKKHAQDIHNHVQ